MRLRTGILLRTRAPKGGVRVVEVDVVEGMLVGELNGTILEEMLDSILMLSSIS